MEPLKEETKKHIDFGCPMCGGAMEFDPAAGELHCPFCEHRMPVEQHKDEEVTEQVFRQAAFTGDFRWGERQKQVTCRSCGATTIYDALETSGVCPFCGSNQVMDEAIDTSLPPNGLCPFEITKAQAGDRFKRWLKKKIFAPSAAKKSARADMFDGMYVPYWTFDAQTSTDYKAQYGIDRTYRDSKGNTHTTTDWHSTGGHYDRFIDDQLVNASERNNESVMRKLEPYDLERVTPFSPEYFSGLKSERYSVGLDTGWEKAKKYISDTLDSEISSRIKKEHNADKVDSLKMSTAYSGITYKYLLMPVWKSSFAYKQKKYDFMVNGQTGRVSGKAPVSPLRVAIAVALIIAIIALVMIFSQSGYDGGYEDDYYYYYNGNAVMPCETVTMQAPETVISLRTMADITRTGPPALFFYFICG